MALVLQKLWYFCIPMPTSNLCQQQMSAQIFNQVMFKRIAIEAFKWFAKCSDEMDKISQGHEPEDWLKAFWHLIQFRDNVWPPCNNLIFPLTFHPSAKSVQFDNLLKKCQNIKGWAAHGNVDKRRMFWERIKCALGGTATVFRVAQ